MSDAVDRAALPFTLIRRDTRAACIVYRHDRADDGIVRLREFRGPDRLKRSRAFVEEYYAAARAEMEVA